MKKTVVGAALLLAVMSLSACRAGEAVKESEVQLMKPSVNIKEGVPDMAKSPTKLRYRPFSTQVTFLLLTLQEEKSGDQYTAVIDNNEWLRLASQTGIPAEPLTAYVDYMLEHENEPFVVSEEVFAKLQKFAAPAPDTDWQKLTNQQLFKRYFTEMNRQYVLSDRELRGNKAFLRGLLERKLLVYIDCESGELTVNY